MAADPTFVHSNGIVYFRRLFAAPHGRAAAALKRLEDAGAEVWISRQVLREYLVAVTRPQATAPAFPITAAVADVRRFATAFQVAEDGPEVTEQLLDLLERHPTGGRQVHDANIVATMLVHGVRRLLTFNGADFKRFGGLITVEEG